MTRLRTRTRHTGVGLWTGLRHGLRWLLRLPLRLFRRRDYGKLRAAMEQLSPRQLSAEASIYWIHPPDSGAPAALGGMREPTTALLEQLPANRRYLILNLRESDAPLTYELPDRERFRAIRFPIEPGALPARDAVLDLFRRVAEFADDPAAPPPAILVHGKDGVSRTSQLLCAWLVWREGLSPEAALTRVQQAQGNAGVVVFVPDGRERGWLREFE